MSALFVEPWAVGPGLLGCAVAAAGLGWLGGPPSGRHTPSPPGFRPGAGQPEWRFEGEYGLSVNHTRRGLEVRWLTEEERAGYVRAIVNGRVVDERTTDPAYAHSAQLRIQASEATLEYGADGSEDLHRTRIRLDPPPPPEIDLPATDSIYVFGDVHGEFDRVVRLLGRVGLIDADVGWTGGRATVVFLGDLLDRGDDVTRLLWFVYRLEREAESTGGRVVTLLGNHEAMVMSGDLRYVSPKEKTIADRHGLSYERLFDPAASILGRWLAAKPGLVRQGDLLFAHGGVSPAFREYTLREYQDTLAAFIREPVFSRWRDPGFLRDFAREMRLDSAQISRRYEFFFGSESVLWYRDLVLAGTLADHLDGVLERFGAAVHVVAHTPVRSIRQAYGGRLIAVDLLDPAAEMLRLLRRPDGGWDRSRVPLEGEPQPLGLETESGG